MVTAKTCTKCRETKPLEAFYRRSSGNEKRRAACKACELQAAKHRRDHPPLITQILRHHADPTAPLSPEAEARIYSTEPVAPELLALKEKREKAEARRLRRLKQEAKRNPQSLTARCYAKMVGG